MKKNLIAILVLIGLVVYGSYDYFKKSPSKTIQITESENKQLSTGILKGQLAPDFTLTDLNGDTVKLSDFKGKIVFVNFWATWCPPCQAEMPHMQNIFEKFKSKDVVILGVNMTLTEENSEDVQTFVNEQQLTFPIVMDEKSDVVQTYQVVAYPTTYLLDKEGVILEKFYGAISYEIMEKYISQIH